MDIAVPPKYTNSRFLLFPPTTSPEKGQSIVRCSTPTDAQGRYWHWDKLKDLQPPKDWSVEEWWAGMKWARNRQAKNLPFVGKNGEAFNLVTPACVLTQLNWLEQNLRQRYPISEAGLGGGSGAAQVRMVEAASSCALDSVAEMRVPRLSFLQEGREPQNADEWMISSNHQALELILGRSAAELTPDLMLELQRLLVSHPFADSSKVGRFRMEEDGIGELWHDPPKVTGLEERLFRICSFANDPVAMGILIHPIVASVILHLMILYDQPFAAANGRLARALFLWSMLKNGYEHAELLSLSSVLIAARGHYERSFRYVVSDGNDATYFVIHQLDALIKACQGYRAE
ncbi:MAG: Fic family protein [Deltaproteobacteria bacterium]|nr:Fic family protein [Deltaproteobacteria bacterium]